MNELIERIRQIIDHHFADDEKADGDVACGCGVARQSDHARHVAEEIVNRLGLRPEWASDARTRVRYVSAFFNDELTKLEGAE